MIVKKIWVLDKPNATHVDATYIMSLGCEVEVIVPTPLEFTSPVGTQWHYMPENPRIEIITTCEKQESMLYLKYGDALHLKSKIHTKISPYYEDFDMVSHS